MDVKITNAQCDIYCVKLIEVEAYTSQLSLNTKMIHTGLCHLIGVIKGFEFIWYGEKMYDPALFTSRLLKKLGFMSYQNPYTYTADRLYIGGVTNRGIWTAERAAALAKLIAIFSLDNVERTLELAELGVEVV